jgi:hypothetical protein
VIPPLLFPLYSAPLADATGAAMAPTSAPASDAPRQGMEAQIQLVKQDLADLSRQLADTMGQLADTEGHLAAEDQRTIPRLVALVAYPDKPAGYDASHLCHNPPCFNRARVILETTHRNNCRMGCERASQEPVKDGSGKLLHKDKPSCACSIERNIQSAAFFRLRQPFTRTRTCRG